MKDRFGYNRGACGSCSDCDEFVSIEDNVKCAKCGCKPVFHEKLEDSDSSLKDFSDNVLSFIKYEGSKCGVPGCNEEVEFDVNTGIEYLFCATHHTHQLSYHETVSMSSLCEGNDIAVENIEEVGGMGTLHVHENQWCMRINDCMVSSITGQHFSNDLSMTMTPSIPKCAIPECPNGCYVDEYGKVHDCCGYNHAMEYQRRLALQNGQCLVF